MDLVPWLVAAAVLLVLAALLVLALRGAAVRSPADDPGPRGDPPAADGPEPPAG